MYLALVIFLTVLADRSSKIIVMSNMYQGDSIPLVLGIFHLTYVRNPGAAFGMLAHRTYILVLVALLVVAGIIYFYRKLGEARGYVPTALGLVAGGALGNLADRVIYGEVIDFIDFQVWPVFNLADTAIVVGAAFLIFYVWRSGDPEGTAGKPGDPGPSRPGKGGRQ